jgi:hypothetical protein
MDTIKYIWDTETMDDTERMLRTPSPQPQPPPNTPEATSRLDTPTIESLFRGFQELMLGNKAMGPPTLFEAIMNMTQAIMMQNGHMLQEIQLLKAIMIQWRNEVKQDIDLTTIQTMDSLARGDQKTATPGTQQL